MKLEHSLTSYTKINSKWNKGLNVRSDILKLLEGNTGRALFDIYHSKSVFDPHPRVRMDRRPKQTFLQRPKIANKHMKRCSTSLIIREMQIITIMRYHPIPVRMAIIKKKSANNKSWRWRGEKEPCCTVCGNVNWYSLYGKQYGDAFKKLGINLVLTQQSHYWAYTLRKPQKF